MDDDEEEKRQLEKFAADLLKVVDQDDEFFIQHDGSGEEIDDDIEFAAGMSFEAQLERLNLETGRELEETLRKLERQLQGLEPLEGRKESSSSSSSSNTSSHGGYGDDEDDPYANVRDGVSHAMTQPASVEEWRTAYPDLCKPGGKLFILGPSKTDQGETDEKNYLGRAEAKKADAA
ncbi:Hypothetical Protein FCC1311_030552 [Hondaea fermentalgiana]|uniref:Uncharacterized protein n=1 Tax=Hondaea fermentalgiana TaxID=2315210 RepID=A0A2R5GDU6_9STRA|nr:Hypothetical Protein FCC1311_030552 [Hondaea fermentalgiana]|eukprot:GBG26833.1 Hypothetical Protein FCC1311_030552 [Hondaea fermentalgiana]